MFYELNHIILLWHALIVIALSGFIDWVVSLYIIYLLYISEAYYLHCGGPHSCGF